jgi:hypothetical protein
MSWENDKRILSLQFLAEVGDALVMAGAAVTGAAMAERIDVLEMALHAARNAVLEAIAEFKTLEGDR